MPVSNGTSIGGRRRSARSGRGATHPHARSTEADYPASMAHRRFVAHGRTGRARMKRGWLLSGAAAVGMVALAQSALANEELLVMQQNAADWVMPLKNYSSTRYSELAQINKSNVGDLRVAWTFSTGVLRGHEGGPLVIGDVMYIHTPFPNIVYALDLNDAGRVIWKYEPQQDPDVIPVMCCDTVNRGVAYGDGKIFLHQADTTLVALDARTGEVVWSVKNGDPNKGETGTSAPM